MRAGVGFGKGMPILLEGKTEGWRAPTLNCAWMLGRGLEG